MSSIYSLVKYSVVNIQINGPIWGTIKTFINPFHVTGFGGIRIDQWHETGWAPFFSQGSCNQLSLQEHVVSDFFPCKEKIRGSQMIIEYQILYQAFFLFYYFWYRNHSVFLTQNHQFYLQVALIQVSLSGSTKVIFKPLKQSCCNFPTFLELSNYSRLCKVCFI